MVRKEAYYREQIILGIHASKIAERERPVQCWNGYGSPQVDYLETTFQEHWRFLGEVTMDASNSGLKSLVNVNPRDRLSDKGASVRLMRLVMTNG